MKNRLFWLDALRAIAAMWVVLFHLNEPLILDHNWYQAFVDLGWLGVPIFFVVSGYCIQMVTQRTPQPAVFLWRRLCRIMFPFWASAVIAVGAVVLIKVLTGVNDAAVLPKAPHEWVMFMLLLVDPVTEVPRVNWVYWSLIYEVLFYTVVAASLLVAARMRFVIYLFLSLWALAQGFGFPLELMFLRDWGAFAAGLHAYSIISKSSPMPRSLEIVGLGAALAGQFANDRFEGALTATIISVVMIAIGTRDFRHRAVEVLANWGESSYGLYLIHVPLGCFLLNRVRRLEIFQNETMHIVFDLSVLAILVAVSAVFFRYVEQPSMQIGRNAPLLISQPRETLARYRRGLASLLRGEGLILAKKQKPTL